MFACVTAVTAQVTEHNPASYGTTGALLGGAYIVRAVGDVGTGALSWLSPMGWAQSVRPYAASAGGRSGSWPWPRRSRGRRRAAVPRDLGGGLVPPGPDRRRRRPGWAGRGAGARLRRASLLGWTRGLVATGVAYGSVGKDVRDLVGDNADLEELIAQGGGSLTDPSSPPRC